MGKTYSGPREALRLTGKFVLSQLLEATKAGPDLTSSPFVIGLQQEVSRCRVSKFGCMFHKHHDAGSSCECGHQEMVRSTSGELTEKNHIVKMVQGLK